MESFSNLRLSWYEMRTIIRHGLLSTLMLFIVVVLPMCVPYYLAYLVSRIFFGNGTTKYIDVVSVYRY